VSYVKQCIKVKVEYINYSII